MLERGGNGFEKEEDERSEAMPMPSCVREPKAGAIIRAPVALIGRAVGSARRTLDSSRLSC